MWWHTRRNQISAKRTSPFKSAGASVQSTTGSRGVRITGSNAEYTTFRGSAKGTGYPFHSPVSSSLSLSCVTVCHHISTWVYLLLQSVGQIRQQVPRTLAYYIASWWSIVQIPKCWHNKPHTYRRPHFYWQHSSFRFYDIYSQKPKDSVQCPSLQIHPDRTGFESRCGKQQCSFTFPTPLFNKFRQITG